MSLIILDLDNTISNDEWRIKHIDWSQDNPTNRYHHYHGLAAFDEPGNVDLFENVSDEIFIFTARPVFYMAPTVEWLLRNGIEFEALFMRENKDFSSSKVLKRKFLDELFEEFKVGASDIVCAYDDREDVVAMYKELGVNAEVRKIHNICAYTPTKFTLIN